MIAAARARIDGNLGNGAEPHARHLRKFDNDVGAHLTRAGETDRQRTSVLGVGVNLSREADLSDM